MTQLDSNLVKKLFHMGERVPADFESPVPNITDAKQLSDPAVLQHFETLVKKIIEKDDQEVALLGRQVLENMLLPLYPQLQDETPEVYERYQQLIVLLKFVNLAVRGLPEIANLIESHLISALRASIPIKKKFQEVLNIYDDTLLSGTISESLTNALSDSSEKLGTTPISLRGKSQPVSPTLANWSLDYRISTLQPVGSGEQIATAFDRVTYIRQSPNVKKLSKDEQDMLLRILELYDWLRFGSALLRTGSEEAAPAAVPKGPVYIKREKLVVPPVVERKAFTTGQVRVAPPPPQPSPHKEREKPRVLPRPPLPPSLKPPVSGASIKYQVSGIKGQSGESPPILHTKYQIPDTSSEDLYRKTLEELAKMRAMEGKEPPVSVNEALIEAEGNSQKPPFTQKSPENEGVSKLLKKLEDKLK